MQKTNLIYQSIAKNWQTKTISSPANICKCFVSLDNAGLQFLSRNKNETFVKFCWILVMAN